MRRREGWVGLTLIWGMGWSRSGLLWSGTAFFLWGHGEGNSGSVDSRGECLLKEAGEVLRRILMEQSGRLDDGGMQQRKRGSGARGRGARGIYRVDLVLIWAAHSRSTGDGDGHAIPKVISNKELFPCGSIIGRVPFFSSFPFFLLPDGAALRF